MHLDSPVITLPNTAPMPRVSFDHWVATEAGWDGGNVKISVNGGAWQVIPATAFIYNGYNATLFTAGQGNTNPMPGSKRSRLGWRLGRRLLGPLDHRPDGHRQQEGQDPAALRRRHRWLRTRRWYVDDLQVVQCR
jgi:hypothetical protein